MSGDIRVLDKQDLPQLLELLRTDVVANLFVASRVTTLGLEPAHLGCSVFGYLRQGRLVAACHLGANVVPIGGDREALAAFIDVIGPRRDAASIMGPADSVNRLYEGLSQRWPGWRQVRDLRPRQPLLVIDGEPKVEPDPRVRLMNEADFESYLPAAIAMYTEEVGVSPLEPTGSYQRYVRMLLQMGRSMGARKGDRVWFKSDIGSAWAGACQVQGVWLDPGLRGRGLSAAAMARVVQLCRRRYPVVSLYVNDYYLRARRLYDRVGVRVVGEFATVLD